MGREWLLCMGIPPFLLRLMLLFLCLLLLFLLHHLLPLLLFRLLQKKNKRKKKTLRVKLKRDSRVMLDKNGMISFSQTQPISLKIVTGF